MSFIAIAMIACLPLMAVHIWAEARCTRLDVETGRRDAMALVDDYGSNRGWYWRYKIVSISAALLAAPGLLMWFCSALAFLASH